MDNTTVIENPMDMFWGIQVPIAMMFVGSMYLASILILLLCVIKHRQSLRHVEERNEIRDSNAIHYWLPYDEDYV